MKVRRAKRLAAIVGLLALGWGAGWVLAPAGAGEEQEEGWTAGYPWKQSGYASFDDWWSKECASGKAQCEGAKEEYMPCRIPCDRHRYFVWYDLRTGNINGSGGVPPGAYPRREGAHGYWPGPDASVHPGEGWAEMTDHPPDIIRGVMSVRVNDYYVDLESRQIRRQPGVPAPTAVIRGLRDAPSRVATSFAGTSAAALAVAGWAATTRRRRRKRVTVESGSAAA